MDKLDKRTQEIVKRLQNARMSLLSKQPFYAMLLLRLKFSLDSTCMSVYTDGERIAFNPDFLDEISDRELEFVLMHEVLHTALGHPFRKQSDYDLECYDKACDIVVNSNILHSFGMNEHSITLKNFGVAAHKTPSGKEGYECTVDEVYAELIKLFKKKAKNTFADDGNEQETTEDDEDAEVDEDEDEDENDEEGTSDGDGEGDGDGDGTGKDNHKSKSGDGSKTTQKAATGNGKGENKGGSKGGSKSGGKGNSAVLKAERASGEKWKDPNEYSLEDLISQLKEKNTQLSQKYQKNLSETKKSLSEKLVEVLDDHSFWKGEDEDDTMRLQWQDYVMKATNLVMEQKKGHKGYGGPPLCATRMVKELTHPEVDWRTVLNEFVQEEVNDYSFSPPDKRMDDCPFFLPDFNEKDERVKNVWFLIDTSGSIGDEQIEAAYSEIISAMDMFGGKLEGLLSFTEVFVTEPIPFCDIDELLEIKPVGGGGNNFGAIFKYMQKNMMDNLPTSIVIFTDGYDFFPPEEVALGIPVFWLINNQEAEPPPWGRWARFKVNK